MSSGADASLGADQVQGGMGRPQPLGPSVAVFGDHRVGDLASIGLLPVASACASISEAALA